MNYRTPKISFCTWVRDWPPLRQTLPVNLALTAGLNDVEFAIADIGSKPPVADWPETNSPRVHVQRFDLPELHFARAYNLSHRMAAGEILVCLDGDNVIGPHYVERLLGEIGNDPLAIVHAWTGDWLDGTCGRLAMHRDLFARIGGYDESLGCVGHQDLDLRDRAQAAGGRVVTINEPSVVGLAIRTSPTAKMQHLEGVDYYQVNGANHGRSRANLAAGKLVANQRSESGDESPHSKKGRPMNLSVDWSSHHFQDWKRWLGHLIGQPCRGMEIGCFEGNSSAFWLREIATHPGARVTFVDPWDYAYEKEAIPGGGISIADNYDWTQVHARFLENIDPWIERSQIHRQDSCLALLSKPFYEYDWIYIDGSHIARCCLEDSVLAWPLLKIGGTLIWDDYTWTQSKPHAKPHLLRPKLAIDTFLSVYEDQYADLEHSNDQVKVRRVR